MSGTTPTTTTTTAACKKCIDLRWAVLIVHGHVLLTTAGVFALLGIFMFLLIMIASAS